MKIVWNMAICTAALGSVIMLNYQPATTCFELWYIFLMQTHVDYRYKHKIDNFGNFEYHRNF